MFVTTWAPVRLHGASMALLTASSGAFSVLCMELSNGPLSVRPEVAS